MGKSLYYGSHGKEQTDLGLTSLDNFSGFWGIGTPSCLILGPEIIRIRKQWPCVWNPNGGDGWGVGFWICWFGFERWAAV